LAGKNNSATVNATMTTLPAPSDSGDTDVVIYDGHCQFCGGQVRRLARWDKSGKLSFLSLHDPLVSERYPELTFDDLMEAMHLVRPDGRTYIGAAAFRIIARGLPRLWPLLPILYIPFSLPLWQAIYRLIARRRYKLSCDDDSCNIHRG
jgi:predicted DCC family thiol-disulfide oxidoreductase YuxK